MPNRLLLASVATLLAVGGLTYGLSSFTSRTKTCPLDGTPACPNVSSRQAVASAPDKAMASAELSPCCKANK